MNKRDIELAAEAGAHWEHGDWNLASSVHFSEEDLQTFADLIRAEAKADEREACAELCESHINYPSRLHFAEAIRARGNT